MTKTFGNPAITVSDKEFNDTVSKIRDAIQAYRDKTKGSTSNKIANNKDDFKARLEYLAELFLVGKTLARQASFAEFVSILRQDFGIVGPTTGALWGGDGAEDQAKLALQGGGGMVLRETHLGGTARKMDLWTDKAKDGQDGHDYAKANQAALQFWGAVSAAYAEQLAGDIHVWMPKGLTVGSIFWNDELPVLMRRKRAGEPFNLIFHINPSDWNQTVTLDDLVIGGAYIADRNGYYEGRATLKAKHNPPGGIDPAADLKDKMALKLTSPIKVATVEYAMRSLLRYHSMKHRNAERQAAAGPDAPKLSPMVLARLAMLTERVRMAKGK